MTRTHSMRLRLAHAILDGYQPGTESYAEAKPLYPQRRGPVECWLYPYERDSRVIA